MGFQKIIPYKNPRDGARGREGVYWHLKVYKKEQHWYYRKIVKLQKVTFKRIKIWFFGMHCVMKLVGGVKILWSAKRFLWIFNDAH